MRERSPMSPAPETALTEVVLSLALPLQPQLAEVQARFPIGTEIVVVPEQTAYRFRCRVHGTDIPVVFDTLVGLYHVPPVPLPEDPVIVDLGSNIGCTIVHYASLYPKARIVGVELDAENVRLARANIEALPGPPMLVHAAIWPSDGVVHYGGGEAWGYRVESSGGQAVDALSMPSLMERAGLQTIDFLKVDIEGAERELFAGDLGWLSSVQVVSIEVHNNEPLIGQLIELLNRDGFQAARDTHHWSAVIGARPKRRRPTRRIGHDGPARAAAGR
jgi:FkbM family methyltransferase